jgi:glycosyltransferase involved in cell wall biosynthesis
LLAFEPLVTGRQTEVVLGTPVIVYASGNLPDPIGLGAGILVPSGAEPGRLRGAARELLADPVRYHLACGAAYCRSRNYRSANVAETFLKAVL